MEDSPRFDVLITHCCYLDLTPGSRGCHLPEGSLLNVCFLNNGVCNFRTEKSSAFHLESWMERMNQVCFCPDPHVRLDSGNWFNRHVNAQKKTLQLGPKLRYNLDVDQGVYLLQHITDLLLFFWQMPWGEFSRFGTSMSWLGLGSRGQRSRLLWSLQPNPFSFRW